MAFVTSTTRRNIHIPDEMDSDSFIVPDGYGFNLRDFSGACIDPTDDGASGMELGAMTCKYRGGSYADACHEILLEVSHGIAC